MDGSRNRRSFATSKFNECGRTLRERGGSRFRRGFSLYDPGREQRTILSDGLDSLISRDLGDGEVAVDAFHGIVDFHHFGFDALDGDAEGFGGGFVDSNRLRVGGLGGI